MNSWTMEWTLLFSIVAFLAASLAVRGWRDLGLMVVIASLLLLPIKWIGPALGLAMFAADALTVEVNRPQGGFRIHLEPSPALLAAIILAAVAMIAAKEIAARRS